jgi:hypothetical protein
MHLRTSANLHANAIECVIAVSCPQIRCVHNIESRLRKLAVRVVQRTKANTCAINSLTLFQSRTDKSELCAYS